MNKNININLKIFISIAFALFIILVLPSSSYCAAGYCEVTAGDETIRYDENGATYYIDIALNYGETIKLHIHKGAAGIGGVEGATCWTDVEESDNIGSANYGPITVDEDWIDEVDFDVDVRFEDPEKTEAKLWIWFGDQESAWHRYNVIIEFRAISNEAYREQQRQEEIEDLEFQEESRWGNVESWENDYLQDPQSITGARDRLDYLRSVLYNDERNGNHNLWEGFVEATTPDDRLIWRRSITEGLRGEEPGDREAREALERQIQLDEEEITEEERDEALEGARTSSRRRI